MNCVQVINKNLEPQLPELIHTNIVLCTTWEQEQKECEASEQGRRDISICGIVIVTCGATF